MRLTIFIIIFLFSQSLSSQGRFWDCSTCTSLTDLVTVGNSSNGEFADFIEFFPPEKIKSENIRELKFSLFSEPNVAVDTILDCSEVTFFFDDSGFLKKLSFYYHSFRQDVYSFDWYEKIQKLKSVKGTYLSTRKGKESIKECRFKYIYNPEHLISKVEIRGDRRFENNYYFDIISLYDSEGQLCEISEYKVSSKTNSQPYIQRIFNWNLTKNIATTTVYIGSDKKRLGKRLKYDDSGNILYKGSYVGDKLFCETEFEYSNSGKKIGEKYSSFSESRTNESGFDHRFSYSQKGIFEGLEISSDKIKCVLKSKVY